VAQAINTIGTLFAVAALARIGAKIRTCWNWYRCSLHHGARPLQHHRLQRRHGTDCRRPCSTAATSISIPLV